MIGSLVRSGSLATIVLDDGGVNRLSSDALLQLGSLLDTIPDDLRMLCLGSGRDGIFAAGADMAEMVSFGIREAERFSRSGQTLMQRIASLHCVTVAMIDGECHGGALDLVSAFDLRLATRRSRFAHPGSRLGIVTGFGGTVRIPARVQRNTTRSIFLGAEPLTAAEAHDAMMIDGLVDELDGADAQEFLRSASEHHAELLLARPLLAAAGSLDLTQMSRLASRTRDLLKLQEKG